MDVEFEDLVADSMRAQAAAVTIPVGLAGMARKARKRHRQRQLAIRGALGAGTAVGTAAVVVAVGAAPQQGVSGPRRAQTAAYILSRADRALASGSAKEVERVRVTGTAVRLPVRFMLRGTVSSTQGWSHGGLSRYIGYAADGRLMGSERIVFGTGSGDAMVSGVDYGSRTWWRGTARVLSPPPASVQPGTAQCAIEVPWIQQWLATSGYPAVKCPRWTIADRQQAEGVSAIKLVPSGDFAGLAIWVDAATYRPVRILDSWTTGGERSWLQIDIRWLPPTQANLARLRQPVPAGFRQIPNPRDLFVSAGL